MDTTDPLGDEFGDPDEYVSPYAILDDEDDLRLPVQRRMRRGSVPASWNRSTRWQAGMSRLPDLPFDAVGHTKQIYMLTKAKTMRDGWEFCKRHPKQEPSWYVRVAAWLMSEYLDAHFAACRGARCNRDGWRWFFDVTDRVPLPKLPSEGTE